MVDGRPILPYDASGAVRGPRCLPPDPRASDVAARLAWLIERWLPDSQVEHIGSTAVPCDGKGVIDLQIIYPPHRLDAVKDVLGRLGFQPQGGRNPFPEDRPMRIGAIAHEGDIFRIHAHVIAADCPEVGLNRAFRDRLRADPALREAYVAEKRAIIASGVTDTVEYAQRKSAFVQDAIRDLERSTDGSCVANEESRVARGDARDGNPSGENPVSPDCFVCRKHRGEEPIPGGMIYEDDLLAVTHVGGELGTYLGHIVIEPKRHAPGVADLTDGEAAAVGVMVTRVGRALKESEAADHIYVFVMGHHVPHLHVHIVPRYPGAPTEFWGVHVDEWPEAPRGGWDEIGALAERLRGTLATDPA
ncbi:MAG TPA: GrpB family protein [Chloroflexota bacterium]|nr:GrpB family protein [Chloroflexota bacterium]